MKRINDVEIKTTRELREVLDDNDWLFIGTGGYHGTKFSLDDIEAILRDEHSLTKSVNERYWVTVLLINPETVEAIYFGDIQVDNGDITWLRQRVRDTLNNIIESQYENS